MSYTALYRKLRPRDFNSVIGQKHIVKTLINQIESDRISHAYLFCGTRGTGKTSTAKIFAKAVNCPNNIDGQPCNNCEVCNNIDSGTSMNIIEIDAASNNGVDNIRDIKEEVKYAPTTGKYKVYIIDEVHMLSIGAFNALLKTLEEPPSYVIFVLATTEPQKIPATIVSRCQRFDFRRISINDMTKALKSYMEEENINIDDDALNYISRVSDGAMRDALSILDQCSSFYFGERITLDKVLEIVGSVDNDVFFEITEALFEKNNLKCMSIIDDIIAKGRDITQFTNELIVHFRNLLVANSINSDSKALDLSYENIEKLKEQSQKIPCEYLLEFINVFSELQTKLKYSSNDRILFEVTCIKLNNPALSDSNSILMRIDNIEKIIENGNFLANASNNINDGNLKSDTANQPVKKIKQRFVPDKLKKIINKDNWRNFVKHNFKDLLGGWLNETIPKYLDNIFYIECNSKGIYDKLNERKEEIKEKIESVCDMEIKIDIIKYEDFKLKLKDFESNSETNTDDDKFDCLFDKISRDDISVTQ